ncbi:related to beta-xylosidase [Phialocephala subalpina]|uniref:Related to beta-xylosidase n=1 Tax=Phialocephala subalpina TaxID=576137 RepID=A0A1L7XL18_9HELO|nr:related to beta-xylosidase [Phialocephala subalpina]
MRDIRIVALSFLGFFDTIVSAMTYPDSVNGPGILTTNLVCNTQASVTDRAAAIVSAFNISEKLVDLVNTSLGSPRLGLAPYEWWSEALHGLAYSLGVDFSVNWSSATSCPNPITISAAFDNALVEAVANVISTEARAFSNADKAGLDFWTPNVNPYKDPRWGRGAETPGEDPFRIKGYTKSLLRGLEGDQKFKKNTAVRYGFDAVVSMQDLIEYYLPPFQQCASNVLVIRKSTVLREHWGYTEDNQYITSDCNAVQGFYANRNYTTNQQQAAGKAYTAGCDTICQVGHNIDVTGTYNQSLLSEATIYQALRRMILGKPVIVAELGDQVDPTPLLSNPNIFAILWAGYPGQNGGTAVLDIITWRTAPARRLPVTVKMTDMSLRPGERSKGRTYMWYNESVLPFGYGLHYTSFNTAFAPSTSSLYGQKFKIKDLIANCTEKHLDLCIFTSFPLNTTVQNMGTTKSDFVLLAFLSGSYGPEPFPIKRLAAYTRVRDIVLGEKRTAELEMTLGTLARVDEVGNTVLYPGKYEVGLDVDVMERVGFKLVDEKVALDLWPQPKVEVL